MAFELICQKCGTVGELEEPIDEFECPVCQGKMLPVSVQKKETVVETAHANKIDDATPTIAISRSQIQEYRNVKIAKMADLGFGGVVNAKLSSSTCGIPVANVSTSALSKIQQHTEVKPVPVLDPVKAVKPEPVPTPSPIIEPAATPPPVEEKVSAPVVEEKEVSTADVSVIPAAVKSEPLPVVVEKVPEAVVETKEAVEPEVVTQPVAETVPAVEKEKKTPPVQEKPIVKSATGAKAKVAGKPKTAMNMKKSSDAPIAKTANKPVKKSSADAKKTPGQKRGTGKFEVVKDLKGRITVLAPNGVELSEADTKIFLEVRKKKRRVIVIIASAVVLLLTCIVCVSIYISQSGASAKPKSSVAPEVTARMEAEKASRDDFKAIGPMPKNALPSSYEEYKKVTDGLRAYVEKYKNDKHNGVKQSVKNAEDWLVAIEKKKESHGWTWPDAPKSN